MIFFTTFRQHLTGAQTLSALILPLSWLWFTQSSSYYMLLPSLSSTDPWLLLNDWICPSMISFNLTLKVKGFTTFLFFSWYHLIWKGKYFNTTFTTNIDILSFKNQSRRNIDFSLPHSRLKIVSDWFALPRFFSLTQVLSGAIHHDCFPLDVLVLLRHRVGRVIRICQDILHQQWIWNWSISLY